MQGNRIPQYFSDKLRILSFASAVLVVLIHVPHPEFARYSFDWWCVNVFFDIITRIAVPYFFFASALLLFRNYGSSGDWYRNMLKKRVRTLLIPFFIANLLALAIVVLKIAVSAIWHHYPIHVFVNEVSRCAYLASGFDITRFPLVGSLWFVRNPQYKAVCVDREELGC